MCAFERGGNLVINNSQIFWLGSLSGPLREFSEARGKRNGKQEEGGGNVEKTQSHRQ